MQLPHAGEPARIRRAPRVLMLVLFIAGTFISALTLAPQASEAAIGDIVRTTANLNLRAGPGTQYGIVLTMPMGASFKITGSYNKGFYPGRYNGIKGWASADYLSTTGTSAPPPSSSSGDSSLVGAIRYTTTNLNLRAGPSTGYGVVLTMSTGSAFKITGSYNNGYYPGRYNGTKGWAYADYLTASQPSTSDGGSNSGSGTTTRPDYLGDYVYTTTALNLRSGPGTSYGIVTTMAMGTAFKITGSLRNGFYPGRVNGGSTIGWAYADYVSYTDPGNGSGNDGGGDDGGGDNGSGSGVVSSSNAGPGSDGVWSEGEIINLIYEAADYYGQPREDMLRVARCESLLNPSLIHPAYNASGLFQFLPGTWATTPYASFYILDPVANAYAAAWMWSVGRRGEWVCQ